MKNGTDWFIISTRLGFIKSGIFLFCGCLSLMWSKDIEKSDHIGNSGQEGAEQSHGMGNPARILNLLLKINCGEEISPNEGRRGIIAGGGCESGLFVPFWTITTSQFQQLMSVMTFRCR